MFLQVDAPELLARSPIHGSNYLADVSIEGCRNTNRQPFECTRNHPLSQGFGALLRCNNCLIYLYLWNGLRSWVEKKKSAQMSAFLTGKVVSSARQMRIGMMM
jgi:hypothetical protein